MLDNEDKDFLLNTVDNPHSDYDESVDGYVNYMVYGTDDGETYLDVSVTTDEKTLEGTWKLTFISGSITMNEEDDDA